MNILSNIVDIQHILTPIAVETIVIDKTSSKCYYQYVYVFGIRVFAKNITADFL